MPRTGITRCWSAAGGEHACAGSGQDGAWRAGTAWPEPRFEDNGDGTVTDRLTDLVWLRDADRFGEVTWKEALRLSRELAAGDGLDDGSAAGDWRLPNIKELLSIVDYGSAAPALPAGNPFRHVRNAIYWTSSSLASAPGPGVDGDAGHRAGGAGTSRATAAACGRCAARDGSGAPGRPRAGTRWGARSSGEGSGQDGDLQAGVAAPDPRFRDEGDGTILDRLTGLVWLKDAGAFGWCRWEQALERGNQLRDRPARPVRRQRGGGLAAAQRAGDRDAGRLRPRQPRRCRRGIRSTTSPPPATGPRLRWRPLRRRRCSPSSASAPPSSRPRSHTLMGWAVRDAKPAS